MSSTIQVYSKGIDVEPEDNGSILVTLDDVDASDFVSEFAMDEILSQYEFSDVHDWVVARLKDES